MYSLQCKLYIIPIFINTIVLLYYIALTQLFHQQVDIEEVRSTSISDSSSSNEPRIRHDSTVRSRHDSNQEQSTSSSVHSFEHPEPEALSPISITNGRKHHRRNLSNLTTGK